MTLLRGAVVGAFVALSGLLAAAQGPATGGWVLAGTAVDENHQSYSRPIMCDAVTCGNIDWKVAAGTYTYAEHKTNKDHSKLEVEVGYTLQFEAPPAQLMPGTSIALKITGDEHFTAGYHYDPWAFYTMNGRTATLKTKKPDEQLSRAGHVEWTFDITPPDPGTPASPGTPPTFDITEEAGGPAGGRVRFTYRWQANAVASPVVTAASPPDPPATALARPAPRPALPPPPPAPPPAPAMPPCRDVQAGFDEMDLRARASLVGLESLRRYRSALDDAFNANERAGFSNAIVDLASLASGWPLGPSVEKLLLGDVQRSLMQNIVNAGIKSVELNLLKDPDLQNELSLIGAGKAMSTEATKQLLIRLIGTAGGETVAGIVSLKSLGDGISQGMSQSDAIRAMGRNVDDRLVQLGTEHTEQVDILDNARHARDLCLDRADKHLPPDNDNLFWRSVQEYLAAGHRPPARF